MKVYNKRQGAPPGAVYVGRPSKWGNPIYLRNPNDDEERADVLRRYVAWLDRNPELKQQMRTELAGKNLVCWCAPKACHADVILRIANSTFEE